MNRKAIMSVYPYIFVSILVIVSGLFMAMLFWETIKEYMITPLSNSIQGSLTHTMTSTGLNNVNDITNAGLGMDFGFDLIFFGLMIYIVYQIFKYAMDQEAISKAKFTIYLFGNMLISGFIIFYFEEIVVWFVTNYIFNFLGVTMPFLNYFVNNMGWLVFLIINGALVANQLKNFISEEVLRE